SGRRAPVLAAQSRPARGPRGGGDAVATPGDLRAGCPLHGAYRPATCLWCHYVAFVGIVELLRRQVQGQVDAWQPGSVVDSLAVIEVRDDGVLVEALVSPAPGAPAARRRFLARPNGAVLVVE